MRNVDAAISGTLEGTEDFVTSSCAAETNIEEGLEGAGAIIKSLNLKVLTSSFGDTLVFLGQSKLSEDTTG